MPDGVYLIESLRRMQIGMDKYKTAELGRSLKRVFRAESRINDCLALAQKEIAAVFNTAPQTLEEDTDDGFYGETAGRCPLCGGEVVRTKFGYGCRGYKEGCKFSIHGVICSRVISIANVRKLLSEGRTAKIVGFISKNGKAFDAALRLENGRAVFDFSG